MNPALARLLTEVPARARCLDVGCGHGSICIALAARDCDVLGIDRALPLPPGARVTISDVAPGAVALINADVLAIDLDVGFDVVLAIGLLHSLGDRDRVACAIRRIAGWTAPGGIALVSWLVDVTPMTPAHAAAYFPPIDDVVAQLARNGLTCAALWQTEVAHTHGGPHHRHHVVYSSWRRG